jgi:hypothetical protein
MMAGLLPRLSAASCFIMVGFQRSLLAEFQLDGYASPVLCSVTRLAISRVYQ